MVTLSFRNVLFEVHKASTDSQQDILILQNQIVLLASDQVELVLHVHDGDAQPKLLDVTGQHSIKLVI